MKKQLSGDSRIWIYKSDKIFSKDDLMYINNRLDQFCREWTAHNLALTADFEIIDNKFIVLAVDETQTDASGCSIDKSVRELKAIGEALNLNLMDKGHMPYIAENEIKEVHFSELQRAYDEGSFKEDTLFYNLNLEKLSELSERFKLPFKLHWASRNLAK